MDNAKIFSQLTSKSRSSAKVSERRLQPVAYAGGVLSVCPPQAFFDTGITSINPEQINRRQLVLNN